MTHTVNTIPRHAQVSLGGFICRDNEKKYEAYKKEIINGCNPHNCGFSHRTLIDCWKDTNDIILGP